VLDKSTPSRWTAPLWRRRQRAQPHAAVRGRQSGQPGLVEQLIARRGDLKLLTAIDGHLGIELARAYLPDVILMDINLPGMSGYDCLKILRDDPVTPIFRCWRCRPTPCRAISKKGWKQASSAT
jgi:CheY-like chemotaxis protein